MSAGSGRRWSWAFAVVIAAVAVVPLGALAYLADSRASDSVRSEVADRLSGNTALTALFFDEHVRGIEEVVASYARRPRLLDALSAPEGPDVAELNRQMWELRDARADVLNVAGITDPDGTMVAWTVAQPPGANFSDREWHQTVRRTARPHVSRALVARTPGQPLTVAIAAPVVDADGRLVAIVVVGNTLDKLQQFVDSFVSERGIGITVTDQAAVVIAQPGAAPTSLVSRADDPFVAMALAGKRGVADDARSPDGERVLIAYAPVPRLGWTVTAELSRAVAYAQVDALHSQVILITIPLAGLLVLGSVVLARSVRARNDAEREQRRVSEQLARIIDISPVPTAITRVGDGRIILANAAMLRTLGWQSGEVVGRTAGDIRLWANPWDRQAIVERLDRDGHVHQMEERLRRRDGTVIDVITSIEAVEFDGAQCLLGLFYDISDRVRAEAELRASQARVQAFVNQLPSPAFLKDRDGRVLVTNDAGAALYGMRAEEVVGKSFDEFLAPELAEAVAARDRAVLETGETHQEEIDFQDPSGTERTVLSVRFPVLEGGAVVGVGAITTDITEQKQLEREAQKAAAAAEEVSRLKSEFLATMSHEIRTPMNGVMGMTRLLLDTELSDEQRDYAETVRSSAEMLLVILNDILDFSKIEAGRLELEEVDFDVALMAEEVAELLATSADHKGLELILHVDPDLPALSRGDPGRVRQILMNLVGNAIKFTDQGTVRLGVATVASEDSESVVRFEVQDTGVGVSADAKQRLFESFTQADSATTRRFGGTGLGLAISKRLVELMGGEIGMDSTFGEGSTFWFSVPLARSAAPAPSRPKTLVGLRVLVVDDIAINCTALSAQLSAWGMTAVAVSSGEEALAALAGAQDRGERFDIVLSDFQMSGMDGVDLADAIAGMTADPLPVIVLSSAGGRESAHCRDSTSVARFLVKPARRSHLFDAIATALGEAPSRRAAHPAVADARPRAAGGRVLVVDDNAANQRIAARLLQSAGYPVHAVGDGAEAVQEFRRGGYDAVLMDCQMPIMDGYAAAAEIRRHEGGRQRVPIIAMTASAMKGDVERALAAGMDAHIAKPIDWDELTRVLQELLDDRALLVLDPIGGRGPQPVEE